MDSRAFTTRDAAGRKQFGAWGEDLASIWLQEHGYRVVARNWRCPRGELDIVCELGDDIIFVEVKSRRGTLLGAPEEAVTPGKQRRLIRAAQYFLLQSRQEQRSYRIDVIAVEVAPSGKLLNIRHYPGCVESEG
jgi:putative endonuclease